MYGVPHLDTDPASLWCTIKVSVCLMCLCLAFHEFHLHEQLLLEGHATKQSRNECSKAAQFNELHLQYSSLELNLEQGEKQPSINPPLRALNRSANSCLSSSMNATYMSGLAGLFSRRARKCTQLAYRSCNSPSCNLISKAETNWKNLPRCSLSLELHIQQMWLVHFVRMNGVKLDLTPYWQSSPLCIC